MKSTMFVIDAKNVECSDNCDSRYAFLWEIKIPLLPAYSVEYLSLKVDVVSTLSGIEGIKDDLLIVESEFELPASIESVLIELHYHGIRDYSALFPNIEIDMLRHRIGAFYEEAEKNFEQGSWLSFSLMCGAIFEGMLYSRPEISKDRTFFEMINYAYDLNIINNNQKDIMHNVRKFRNIIHANKYETPFVTRKDAMDIRTTLDGLIKDFSL